MKKRNGLPDSSRMVNTSSLSSARFTTAIVVPPAVPLAQKIRSSVAAAPFQQKPLFCQGA